MGANTLDIFGLNLPVPAADRAALRTAYLIDEASCVSNALAELDLGPELQDHIAREARVLVEQVRNSTRTGLDALLQEYDLSSVEGVVLMCLAESLLRIPDSDTADKLIREKLAQGNWEQHLGHGGSVLVNASTWGLMLTGRLIRPVTGSDIAATLRNLVARGGEPLIRLAFKHAMEIIGKQFVLGQNMEEALARSRGREFRDECFSFDILGEAALSSLHADHYLETYHDAVRALAKSDLIDAGISIKLSALHPRFEYAQRERVLRELVPRLLLLARSAAEHDLLFTIDAEELSRLELTLDVFEALCLDEQTRDWCGLGIVVQSYQKRALELIAWLADLAVRSGRRIPVRLVKGAYWDSEIKRAQVLGLAGYPVFTRKAHTDLSYLACARRLLAGKRFVPQFATHNAHTIAVVLALAGKREVEFQRLHGMGQVLHEFARARSPGFRCRVYAPVGGHAELLPYLVRRLLENGSNTSFVNRIVHRDVPADDVVADPVELVRTTQGLPNPKIPAPVSLWMPGWRNSAGVDLTDVSALIDLRDGIARAATTSYHAAPLIDGLETAGEEQPVKNPADRRKTVGHVIWTTDADIEKAVSAALTGFQSWHRIDAVDRAAILERAGDNIEAARDRLVYLCINEAGKTIADALADVREAADYCRYYAHQARGLFAHATKLPGPSGERNSHTRSGRGVFACISPWNFPAAIFTGQIVAALAAGNTVLAKPAEQAPLCAAEVVRLLHGAGVPANALQLLPGNGATGAALVRHPDIAGVVFTGGTDSAHAIHRALAAKNGPIVPLIAETGGQNVMLMDSSALTEQVVHDALRSAFNSAGQRCSALRVLFVQDEVAERTIEMLTGAMAELVVGDPMCLATDIGPVIDDDARVQLEKHIDYLERHGRLLYRVPLPAHTEHGSFFAPAAYEIESLDLLQREVFGPVLHVIRYPSAGIDQVIEAINSTGYGLTLGIHSRMEQTADYVAGRVRVGNVYVNRDMIGAVVGAQPFGGEGLSGTGPKAGGPDYLLRFCREQTLSVNTAAVGGDPSLLTLDE